MNLRRCSLFVVLAFGLSLHLSGAAEPEKKPAPADGTKPAPPGEKESGKTAAAEFTDPEEAFKGIPRDVMQDLRPGSRKMEDAVVKASQIVAKNVETKMATLKFTVANIEKFNRDDAPGVTRYRVHGMLEKIRAGGAYFNLNLMAVPDVSEDDKIAKLKTGDKVTFTGKVSNGEITARTTAELHIDLMDAKIK
ncbi:MAG: hypothetical protein U0984_07980 [Prosthecobacter sp.]|nr:hypothetical protein [Prosthecobacter sp.]